MQDFFFYRAYGKLFRYIKINSVDATNILNFVKIS